MGPSGRRRQAIDDVGWWGLAILHLLSDGPRHGYGIMRFFRGNRPAIGSPPGTGTIYPTLEQLRKDGLIEYTVEGRRKVYSLTDAGRRSLPALARTAHEKSSAERSPFVAFDAAETKREVLDHSDRFMTALQQAMGAGSDNAPQLIEIISNATRQVYQLLADTPTNPARRAPP
ncbi:MAG: PadR family transcriptional regulator [Vulcanimicrobiaceae bacterium]